MIVKAERTGGAPEPVEVNGQHVWLRKNIETSTREVGSDGHGTASTTVYSYDEVHYADSTSPTAEQVRENFEELWSAHASDGMTAEERMAAMMARLDEQDAALMELGDMLGGE